MIVIDKAAGMVVHPAAGNWSGTLLNALLARDPASATLPRAGIVHRLDKDTSGLMVVGRTLAAVTALTRRDRRARGAAPLSRDRARRADAKLASRSKRRSAATRKCARGWPSSPAASRRGPTSSGSPSEQASRRCAVRCTPAARTRSASTSPRAACRWSAIAPMAARRRSAWSDRPCTRTSSRSAHPVVGRAAVVSPSAAERLRARLGGARRRRHRLSRPVMGPTRYNRPIPFRCERSVRRDAAPALDETIET